VLPVARLATGNWRSIAIALIDPSCSFATTPSSYTLERCQRRERIAPEKAASPNSAGSTASRFVLAGGARGTAPLDAPTATEPGRCHRLGKGYVSGISSPFCDSVGGPGIARKVVPGVLRSHHRKTDFAANMAAPFNRAHGLEDATPRAVMSALTAAPGLRPPKRGIGHD
jgi:hypothetical protein